MTDSIEKIILYVKNQKEARGFWTERMGLTVCLEQQTGADRKWLEVGPEISRKLPYGSTSQFYDMDGNAFLLREEAKIR